MGTKVVPLRCQVPIQFEFELKIAKPNAFFEVSPTQGVIPANGQVDITFNFHPLRLHTATMEIEVNISQFGFEPFLCVLTGVGQPDTSSSEPRSLDLPRTLQIEDTKISSKLQSNPVQIKRP